MMTVIPILGIVAAERWLVDLKTASQGGASWRAEQCILGVDQKASLSAGLLLLGEALVMMPSGADFSF